MDFRTLGCALLNSITAETGALCIGLAVAAPILAGLTAEMMFGRPSSTSVLAFPFAIIYGVGGAIVGGALGMVFRSVWRRTRWVGQVDRRIVAVLAVAVVIVPTALAVRAVLAFEAFNTPRVIAADGRIVASAASELREPRSLATLLWAALPDDAPKVNEISWNGRVVRVTSGAHKL
jgi:hypothetical protein